MIPHRVLQEMFETMTLQGREKGAVAVSGCTYLLSQLPTQNDPSCFDKHL